MILLNILIFFLTKSLGKNTILNFSLKDHNLIDLWAIEVLDLNFIKSKKITFIRGSTTDLGLLQQIFRNVDYVFHEAAIPSVPRSVVDPLKSNFTNVNGTLNVLVAARDNGIQKVVYASSSSVYGDTPTLPKKENMRPTPMSPYAVSKLTGEYSRG